MKYFKNSNDVVFAYESDGSQDSFINPILIPISEEEADRLRTPPPPTIEHLAATARAKRNKLISATDYLLAPDYPLDADRLIATKVHRQALRDITTQPGFPDVIDWPILAAL